jgi:glycerophosphoryl diester phosphodiesterase
MKIFNIPLVIIFCIIFQTCERVEYFPDKPIVVEKTHFLVHRGGGEFDEGNTYKACIYGLPLLDGIECDLQKSRSNTLWLNHSPLISSCGTFAENCFASLSDNSIIQIDSCLGVDKDYTTLERIFAYMHDNYPNKYISLDVKAWSPCDIAGLNITQEMNEMGQAIINLTIKYNLQHKVMVESETGDFLYYVKTHSSFIETYLSTNGDFELGVSRALNAGFSGVSFKYKYLETITKEHIDLIHKKGLKIQLWTLNDSIDMAEALALKPDFIQTDNAEYYKHK